MIPTVGHRMVGLHARKDPLMEEKIGSALHKESVTVISVPLTTRGCVALALGTLLALRNLGITRG
eukprot:454765-Amphidinium_carterae.1